jgi:hypothetical protein
VVPNLWWGVPESNIGNGGKNQKKKGVKIKTQKQSYEVLVYKAVYVTHNLLNVLVQTANKMGLKKM